MTNEHDQELLPEDDQELEPEDQEQPQEDKPDELALLRQEVETLRTQNERSLNQVKAAIGRYQSLAASLAQGSELTASQAKKLESSVGAVEKALDTLLEDETLTPEVRARARAAKTEARAAADTAAMRDEIDALKRSPARAEAPVQDSDELAPIERTVHLMIRRAGMKIEDFDWAEASKVYSTKGDDGILDFFQDKIDAKRAESKNTDARQARKTTAGTPPPEGAGTSSNMDTLLTTYANDPSKLSAADRARVEKYMTGSGVLSR